MAHALAMYPLLRLTLLHWKQHMRMHIAVQYIGPNNGQISMYALFTILLSHIKSLLSTPDARTFEEKARQITIAYLNLLPRNVRTPDMLSETSNLTSRSFMGKDMARALAELPRIQNM